MEPRLGALAAGLLFTFTAQVAWAYVPPAQFLLRTLAEKRRSLKIKDMTVQLTAEVEGSASAVDERLYFKRPERMRLVRQEADRVLVFVQRDRQSARGPEGEVVRLERAQPDLLPFLLLPKGNDLDLASERILEAVAAVGIDTEVVSLGRWEGDVAYIIGAKAWEADKPQLWLNKSTFLPMRYIFYDKTSGEPQKRETRLLQWGSSTGGNWFPYIVEEYENDKRVRRAEVAKVQINDKLPETLFVLPR